MKIKFHFFLIISLIWAIINSCTLIKKSNKKRVLIPSTDKYLLSDGTGKFLVKRQVGYKKKQFVVKRQIFPTLGENKIVLEKSISISDIEKIEKKIDVLRPIISQYMVWFNKKKYFTQLKLNKEKRNLTILMRSPEGQWNGEKEVAFPEDAKLYCFYTQLIECAKITGFIKMAMEKKTGMMNLYVIWDGYPYFQQQYVNVPLEVFSKASLAYDGKNKENESRFTLEVAGQSIFYLVNEKGDFVKKHWVTQGLSMVKNDSN